MFNMFNYGQQQIVWKTYIIQLIESNLTIIFINVYNEHNYIWDNEHRSQSYLLLIHVETFLSFLWSGYFILFLLKNFQRFSWILKEILLMDFYFLFMTELRSYLHWYLALKAFIQPSNEYSSEFTFSSLSHEFQGSWNFYDAREKGEEALFVDHVRELMMIACSGRITSRLWDVLKYWLVFYSRTLLDYCLPPKSVAWWKQ